MRVRALGGDIPDEDQLAAKIEVLQERLNEKREQLLERHLVLDEVSHLRYGAEKSDANFQLITPRMYNCLHQVTCFHAQYIGKQTKLGVGQHQR